jgi:hypothetical protein
VVGSSPAIPFEAASSPPTARGGRLKDLDSTMLTTRHRSVATVREYVQRQTLHERGAGEALL